MKRALYIPENSSPLQEKFINYIMMQGKKSIARRIFNDTLKLIGKKTSGDPEKLFRQAIDKVKPLMEVKPKRIGGAVYQIPREVKPDRQITLAFRWIIGAARKKKGSFSISKGKTSVPFSLPVVARPVSERVLPLKPSGCLQRKRSRGQ